MHLPDLLDVSLRSALVYIALLAALRLAGKRHAGQLSPHDFVLVLLVSNAVQNAMVGPDVSLAGGLVAAATLILINVLITRFLLHHRRWGRLFSDQPTLLIHNGLVLHEHLEREGILLEELEAQIRGHGLTELSQVKAAVQEADGTISVIAIQGHPEYRIAPLGRHHRARPKHPRTRRRG